MKKLLRAMAIMLAAVMLASCAPKNGGLNDSVSNVGFSSTTASVSSPVSAPESAKESAPSSTVAPASENSTEAVSGGETSKASETSKSGPDETPASAPEAISASDIDENPTSSENSASEPVASCSMTDSLSESATPVESAVAPVSTSDITSASASQETSASSGTQTPAGPPEFLTTLPIPSALTAANTEKPGRVETFTYQTKVYDIDGNGGTVVEKKADVYLPYGYDENSDKRYNVLYLMHGGGETYTYWLTENKKTVNMLDNMFANGIAEPCIVVAPTFYTNAPGTSGNSMSTTATDVFRWEFRNDLVPSVEAAYATYAKDDTSPEGLIATRKNRGYAGLSMGSMVSIRSILIGCLDICAYVNSMSGGYAANTTETQTGFDLIKEAMTVTFKKYRVSYWLNQNGNNDMALGPHEQLYNMILEDGDLSRRLKEDANLKWIKFPTGSHSYDSWIVGTYNCLLVFFK